MSNSNHLEIIRQGADEWNRWRDKNNEIIPDLSGANLCDRNLSGINFAGAKLIGTRFDNACLGRAILDQSELIGASFSCTNISNARVCGANLCNANLVNSDLSGSELLSSNLTAALLTNADLTSSRLNRAKLIGACLQNAKLIGADLSGANLQGAIITSACLEDWNVNSTTKLQGIGCDYVYLKANHQERRPHGGNFQPGEFTKRFQKLLETVDLFFVDGVDWKAFLASFQDLQSQYGDENLAVQGIEHKGHSSFEIRLAVPADVNKAEIEWVAYERYETKLKLLESQYREQITAKEGKILSLKDELLDAYRQQSSLPVSDMMEIVKMLAARPINPIINIESKAVAESKAPKYDLSNAQFAGGFAEIVQGKQIGGNINNQAVPEKQSLADAALEIQRLLKLLEETNPTATEAEQKAFVTLAIPSTLRQRAVSALQSGGRAAVEELLDNPYVNVAIAIIEGWQSAE